MLVIGTLGQYIGEYIGKALENFPQTFDYIKSSANRCAQKPT